MGKSGCVIQNAHHNHWNHLPHIDKFTFFMFLKKEMPIVFFFFFLLLFLFFEFVSLSSNKNKYRYLSRILSQIYVKTSEKELQNLLPIPSIAQRITKG